MIDIKSVKYRLVAVLSSGEEINITDVCEEIMWEESEGEFSTRISFTSCNPRLPSGQWLTELLRPNDVVAVYSMYDNEKYNIMTVGKIKSWEPSESNKECILECTANDILHDIQKSQEYRYIPQGTGTGSAIIGILSAWGLRIGTYAGPSTPCKKKTFKSSYVGDEIIELLEDAEKAGAEKTFLRARISGRQNVVDVIPRGTNTEVYALYAGANVPSVSYKIDISDIVTRVIILSKQDDEKRQSVIGRVDGHTQYGIHQRVITCDEEEGIAGAIKEAKEILEDDGKPERKYKLTNAPDIPPLRKGDKIFIHAGALDGYYYVKSITHYASKRTMTIEVEDISEESFLRSSTNKYMANSLGNTQNMSNGLIVGAQVSFTGKAYDDSYATAPADGKDINYKDFIGKIEMKTFSGNPAPYYISGAGWVKEEDITLEDNNE